MVAPPRQSNATASKRTKRPRKRSLSTASSAGQSSGDGDDKAAMLAALEAHQRSLFGMDEPQNGESSAQGAERLSGSSTGSGNGDEEEWGSDDDMEDGNDLEDEAIGVAAVPEIVFAATGSSRETISGADKRAFLKGNSSKLMGIQSEEQRNQAGKKRRKPEEEDADEQSNMKLDKTLHDMLLTNLLPSSASASSRRPVDKQKAISGRLLELARYELSGQGSSSLSKASLSSHSAKIRTGIIQARDKKADEARKEAEASSWVRGVGTVGKKKAIETGRQKRAGLGVEVGKKKGLEGRKSGERDRGLNIGVGKFRDGMLKLSKGEIARGSRKDDGPRFKKRKGGRQ